MLLMLLIFHYCKSILEALNQMKIRLFCVGVPVASTISLTEGLFKAAGLLMACSIVQGGPAPNFMASWVYDYLAFGLHHVPLKVEDVEDTSVREVAEKVSKLYSLFEKNALGRGGGGGSKGTFVDKIFVNCFCRAECDIKYTVRREYNIACSNWLNLVL